MEGFKFSMQGLLDISLSEEDEAKNVYEVIAMDLNILKNTLNDIDTTIKSNSSISNVEDINLFHLRRNYVKSLEIEKEELLKKIKVKEDELNNAQIVYVEKQVDRQLMEDIRDKELKEYSIQAEMEEQNRNDEFALYSYVKKSSN